MYYCIKCGAKLEGSPKFCYHCGQPLAQVGGPAVPPGVPPSARRARRKARPKWLMTTAVVLLVLILVCGIAATGAYLWLGPQRTNQAAGILGGRQQEDPETIARRFVEALVEGDCEKAMSYMTPDKRRRLDDYCDPGKHRKRLLSVRIDDTLVRKAEVFGETYWTIVFFGEFKITIPPLDSGTLKWETGTIDEITIEVERVEGRLYVYDYEW